MPAVKPRKAKRVRESQSEITQVVLPNDANPMGNILGGAVMHLVDIAAAIAAHRHCGTYVVTASIDNMVFRFPIRVGQIIVLKSSVNRVFGSSMEVGVKVFREDVMTQERKHTNSAYLTFVSVDAQGKPMPAPKVIPESKEEKRRYREAGMRRRWRLSESRKKNSKR